MSQLRKNILIVDDDKDLLYCYQLMLENENTCVYTANNPSEAVALLQASSIDIALLDYMLPKMTGAQLAKLINETCPLAKIFFVSGYDEAVEAIRKLDVPVYGVFKKPIDPFLLEKLASVEDYSGFVQDSGNIAVMNLFSNI